MAVVLQTQGTVSAVTTGNLSVTLPAYVANDIVVITTAAYIPNTTTGTNTQSLANPWTKYSPAVTTITGGIIDTEHAFWWARATSSSSLGTTVSITRPASWDTGNDTAWGGRAYVIRGCITTGNPFDQLVASALSTAANPPLPAVTVSGVARLVIAFYVATDNLTAPTAASGYTPGTAAPDATGTDTGFQTYTDATNASLSAVTPSGGATSAQNFQVYFSASFAPEPAILTGTASGFGTGTQTGDDLLTAIRTATGSGVGSGSGDDQLNHQRTASGGGTGTQSANGSILVFINRTATGVGSSDQFASGVVPVTYSRTAGGAGSGTQSAVGVKTKLRTAISDGGLGGAIDGFTPIGLGATSNSWSTSVSEFRGISFTGDGRKLSSVSFVLTHRNAGETGFLYARLYAHTGTYGTTGTGTGSPLAISTPIDVTTIPTSNSGLRLNVRFDFPDSDKYLLVDGTKYVIGVFYAASGVINPISIYGNNTTTLNYYSGNSSLLTTVWTTASIVDYSFAVEAVSATGLITKSRTATGSGAGTQSASGAIFVAVQRTASGSGVGTMDSTGLVLRFRTASGSGFGASTADTLHNNIRSASGAGGASPGASATGRVTRVRTASGSGAGTSNSFGLHVHIETATGFGTSTQTATVSVYQVKLGGLTDFSFPYRFGGRFYVGVFVVSRTATGSGAGTQSSTSEFTRARVATGSGLGTSSAQRVITRLRTGADSAGTGSSAASRVVTRSRSATASGLGVSSSTALLTVIRTSTGSGNGSSSGSASTIRLRTAVGNGLGSSYSLQGILYVRTSVGFGSGDSSAIWYKTLIFRPPFDGEFRWAEYGATDSTSMFFGRMRPGQKASNIYKMVDGTYTTIPSRDYSIVSRVYHGGHENLVTPEEKADLTAAGYGDYVT